LSKIDENSARVVEENSNENNINVANEMKIIFTKSPSSKMKIREETLKINENEQKTHEVSTSPYIKDKK
jgi:stress response protein YsnF